MLPLFSYWLHRLLGYWGFGYLMCFGVFVIFGNSYQAEAKKLSACFTRTFALFFLFLQSFFQDSQMATGGGSASSSQSSALSSEQLQLVVAAVKEGMKEELSSLKRELVGEREQSGNRLLKKLRLEKLLTFSKKSHEH